MREVRRRIGYAPDDTSGPGPDDGRGRGEERKMKQTRTKHAAATGDVVVVESHHVGGERRLGEIVEVLGEGEREHYRVRWEDDRETIFYPGSSDATIEHHRDTRGRPSQSESGDEPQYDEPVLTHEP
jgi:Domain of unknown function (DUF1918)